MNPDAWALLGCFAAAWIVSRLAAASQRKEERRHDLATFRLFLAFLREESDANIASELAHAAHDDQRPSGADDDEEQYQ